MARLSRYNENCIKQLIHFLVPCLGIMEDLTFGRWMVRTLPRESGSSTYMGSGPGGSWLPGPKNALGSRGPVALRSSRSELASGG
jgi:hypothetical protein